MVHLSKPMIESELRKGRKIHRRLPAKSKSAEVVFKNVTGIKFFGISIVLHLFCFQFVSSQNETDTNATLISSPSLSPSLDSGSGNQSIVVEPTIGPTQTQTLTRTQIQIQTSVPTVSPTLSKLPTLQPTNTPLPTPMPTSSPTNAPTSSTVAPTTETFPPTTSPRPSVAPSISQQPSESLSPTQAPTAKASDQPSSVPSPSPSSMPTFSQQPSYEPSSFPSGFPSVSVQPSFLPSESPLPTSSDAPSSVPSFSPTMSAQPSPAPSSRPSLYPTNIASSSPTLAPTLFPTPGFIEPILSQTLLLEMGGLDEGISIGSIFRRWNALTLNHIRNFWNEFRDISPVYISSEETRTTFMNEIQTLATDELSTVNVVVTFQQTIRYSVYPERANRLFSDLESEIFLFPFSQNPQPYMESMRSIYNNTGPLVFKGIKIQETVVVPRPTPAPVSIPIVGDKDDNNIILVVIFTVMGVLLIAAIYIIYLTKFKGRGDDSTRMPGVQAEDIPPHVMEQVDGPYGVDVGDNTISEIQDSVAYINEAQEHARYHGNTFPRESFHHQAEMHRRGNSGSAIHEVHRRGNSADAITEVHRRGNSEIPTARFGSLSSQQRNQYRNTIDAIESRYIVSEANRGLPQEEINTQQAIRGGSFSTMPTVPLTVSDIPEIDYSDGAYIHETPPPPSAAFHSPTQSQSSAGSLGMESTQLSYHQYQDHEPSEHLENMDNSDSQRSDPSIPFMAGFQLQIQDLE